MSLHDPFDSQKSLSRCSCGHHGSQAEHDMALAQDDVDALNSRVVQTAVMRALFPQDAERRRFLSVGRRLDRLGGDFLADSLRRARGDGAGKGQRWRRRTSRSASSRSPAPAR